MDEVSVNPRRRARGTQVCRYKIPMLKKAITRMRREKKVKRSDLHKPVGQMKAQDVINYLYDTAKALHWDWASVISGPEKKRVAKKCKAAPGAGAIAAPPSEILPKRPSGKLTPWQAIVKQVFQDPVHKGSPTQFKMRIAKEMYARQKEDAASAAAAKARGDRLRAMPKIKKKRKRVTLEGATDSDARAQAALMGLPTQFTGRGKSVRKNEDCPDGFEHKMPDGYMCGKQHGSGKKNAVYSF